MIKQILIITISFVLLIPLSVFAQDSLTCPKGAYHGLDNAGNDACRNINTNQIVQGITTQNKDSSKSEQTDPCVNPLTPGCISLPSISFGENPLLIFGIIVIIFVITIIIAASKRKKPTIPTYHSSTNWSTYTKPNSGDRIMWTCSICKQKFADRSSYMSHGCHFR